jgi:predicted DNA binding protein
LAALEYGYYKVPKKTTAEQIASKNKVPRTTFEEHLRKAESKVLRAMAPYVRMYASRPQRTVERAPEIAVR